MEDKNKEVQLKEEEAKKVTGGMTNPIAGGVLDNSQIEDLTSVHAELDVYQPDLIDGARP